MQVGGYLACPSRVCPGAQGCGAPREGKYTQGRGAFQTHAPSRSGRTSASTRGKDKNLAGVARRAMSLSVCSGTLGGLLGWSPCDTRTHSDPEEGDTNQKNPTRTWLPPTEEPLKRLCPKAPRTAPPALESCNTPNVSQAPQDCADVTLRPPVPPAALSSASAKEEPDNRTHVKI